MNLYIVRHGTTPWNVSRRIQGRTDIPLDPPGEEIARLSGRKLAQEGIRFHSVYSSPLIRAFRTAQLISPASVIQTDPRLKELSFGAFEGQFVERMKEDETCPFRFFRADPEKYNEALLLLEQTQPGQHFESLTSLCRRAESFLKDVIEPLVQSLPADANVLIAGHGALNKALMMHIQGSRDMNSFWGKGLQANCGFYLVRLTAEDSGRIFYETDEECRIYYDPGMIKIPGLL